MREREKTRQPGDVEIPHDPISESVLLVAMLTNAADRQRLLLAVPVDKIFEPKHKAAWEAIAEADRRKLGVDLATLKKLGKDVDADYLKQLLEDGPETSENLAFHVARVLWDAARLTTARGPVHELVQALRDPLEEPGRVKALARNVQLALEDYEDRGYMRDRGQLVHELGVELRARSQGVISYSYGIDRLDYYEVRGPGGEPVRRMIPGSAPGKITLLTGMRGVGKSTIAAGLALGLGRNKRKVLYGAWEVTGVNTIELLACMSLAFDRSRLHMRADQGGLRPEEIVQMEEKAHAIGSKIVFLDMPFHRRKGEKRAGANQRNLDMLHGYIADSGCEVFIGDLFKQCLDETRPEEEEQALKRTQAMFEETKVHGILVHQQKTKGEDVRADKRPTLEGAKGSAMWTEAADTVIGVYRAAAYKAIPDDKLELVVLKQRFGKAPLIVEFDWDPDTGLITGGVTKTFDYADERGGRAMDDMMAPPVRSARR